MNKTNTRGIEIYQIRRNDDGDFLFVIPAHTSVSAIDEFTVDGDDLILHHQNGRRTVLYELPDHFVGLIAAAANIKIVEIRDKQPVADHQATNTKPR